LLIGATAACLAPVEVIKRLFRRGRNPTAILKFEMIRPTFERSC
jgi:hypothetical protein